ncbi:hypothetical protein [Rhodococcus marinonascens]|uniref:hypothetical protein n=1 Tax=Rhodococcus marinonascens TaxID=38311 RepID=UPI000933D38D|nr:hypothetical protein [Rhodococcus marinonascens]
MGRRAEGTPGRLSLAVAAEIRAELARQGLPLSALDDVIGSHTYTYERLRGKRSLNLDEVEMLCDRLGTSSSRLFAAAREAAALSR